MAGPEALGGHLADREWMTRVLDETHARMGAPGDMPSFGRTVKTSSHIRIGAEHPARVDPKDRSKVLVVASP
jgi:hypothetical protein